ncbi:hypothetical protein [Peribacillus muralis]|uniref:hypothetical protein n=1 Tax=Peribacillus muralis TaxID=264697 RepID=UPI003CFF5A41
MDNQNQYYHGLVIPINQQHDIQSADEFNRQQQSNQQWFRHGYRDGYRTGQQAGFHPRQMPSWPMKST